MEIQGLQKMTLLDYPGKVACTVFLGGCDLRCPFCHNGELVEGEAPAALNDGELTAFLKKRQGLLDGVCVTGGEPLLRPELEGLLSQIKSLGFPVKLDTNGYKPDLLRDLCGKRLLDFVAMDIKAGRSRYAAAAGVDGMRLERIDESIRFLLEGSVPYEFRTTVVRGLHTEEDFKEIGPWIKGCGDYYLQNFTESGQVLEPGVFSGFGKEELEGFAQLVRPYVGRAALRGIDY